MDLDVVFLSRLQFALTIMFHYLFPPLTIGMGVVLVFLEARYLWTKNPVYETAAKFWTQLFAVTFAVGVATGIVMEFQFGTNWAGYSRFVGDVFGSALAAEGIFAFFLESGFLAVLVFGWDKVSPAFHMVATTCVAVGSTFSAVWIIIANSWQQTPAGSRIVYRLIDGVPVPRAETVDFWQLCFNPSTVERLTHTIGGAWVTGAFFVMSISAWYLLKGKHEEFAKRSFTGGLLFGTLASVLMGVTGHFNAKMVAEHQPAKLAAFEGHFKTGPADLSLIGLPDTEKMETPGISISGGLSFLVHEDFEKPVLGLDKVPREYWPNVTICYFAYHIMIGLGGAFVGLTFLACFLLWRGKLFSNRKLLWVFVLFIPAPFVANEVGWVAAECGRQPWVVHPTLIRDEKGEPLLDQNGMIQYKVEEGLLTRDGVSHTVPAHHVLVSIILFCMIYALLFFVWVYVLNEKIQKGPHPALVDRATAPTGILSAAAGRTLHEESMSDAKSGETKLERKNPEAGP
ncbi:MAG TPA: cytochrome ubiquinol oxidase subunit I [Planctomycetota bacterium]|nr:cytochrome ubiquinol oxidase subunit I [Planctomycetota bacterium]